MTWAGPVTDEEIYLQQWESRPERRALFEFNFDGYNRMPEGQHVNYLFAHLNRPMHSSI